MIDRLAFQLNNSVDTTPVYAAFLLSYFFQLPDRLAYADILEIVDNKILPYNHIAIETLLQENIFEGTDAVFFLK